MSVFRAPHDASSSSRRDFLRNGSYSIALVCTFGTTESLKGPSVQTSAKLQTSAARRAQFKPQMPTPTRNNANPARLMACTVGCSSSKSTMRLTITGSIAPTAAMTTTKIEIAIRRFVCGLKYSAIRLANWRSVY